MTLVYKAPAVGPGTHALVVGVGDYPHLHRGGTNLVPPEHGNVAQPTSPPQSARAVATWLLTAYANDTRMLQSLELLISDPLSAHFNMPDGRTPSIGRATFAGMDKAVKDWKERGDSNAEEPPGPSGKRA